MAALTLDGHPWHRLDELIDDLKDAAARHAATPESIAMIFHDGRLSALLWTPPFVLEDADMITDALCEFVPSTMPDQVAVVWPARFEDGEVVIHAMKVHRWEASRRDKTVTTIVPVPLDGSPDGPAFDIDPPDPWSKRLAAALHAGPAVPGIMDTRLPDGFEFAVAPSSPLVPARNRRHHRGCRHSAR